MFFRLLRKSVVLFFILSFLQSTLYSQQCCCVNSNFNLNNFTNWQGFTGNYGNPAASPGIVGGRHDIITTQGIDPNTCGGLQMIPPGSNRSARLGNGNTGAQGERLTYTMAVTSLNALFVYKYACVLEDPGHSPSEQPTFQARLLDANGQQINGNCGIYTVYAGQPGQNFQSCGGVKWLPWTVVGVNLSPFIGTNVTIEFTTRDCSLSGHFGYAYVVAECMPLQLDLDYCFGSNQITIAGPAGFQNYQWSSGQNTQSITVPVATAAPQYTVTMQSFSNQGNCNVSLTAAPIPTSIQNDFTFSSVCPWEQAQFFSTPDIFPDSINGAPLLNGGANQWFWDFGDGTLVSGNDPNVHMNPTHVYQQSGTYNVEHIVITQAGCSDTISQVVTVAPPPLVDFSTANTCVNDSITLTNLTQDPNLPAVTYSWDFGDNSQTSSLFEPSHSYNVPGNYTINLAASNVGGCSDTISVPITVYDLPIISAGSDTSICPGFPILLNANGAITYQWETLTPNGTNYSPDSTQFISVIGTDVNGCSNSDSLFVSLFPNGFVDAGPDVSICYGNNVTIQANGSVSYQWNNNIIDGQTFLPNIGIDTNIVVGANTNGCLAIDSMVLTVWSNPGISAGPDQSICEGDSTFVSGNGAVSYTWNNGAIINQDYFIPSTNGIYTLVGTDSNGCIGFDTLQINIEPAAYPNFFAPITSSCHPFTANLINTSTGTPAVSAVWDFGDGNESNSLNNASHTYSFSDCFDVSLTLTTLLGCVWDTTIPQYLCDYPNPVADFTPSPVELTNLDNVSEMINESQGATNYYWDFGYENATSTEFSPEHIFPSYPSATYTITLIAETEFGCLDSTSNTVNLTENQIFYVPNSFTPDEDEHNQTWLPIITSNFDPYNYSCLIYNRWGELIFESRDHLVGWDGSFGTDGRDAQNGIYTWVISLKTPQVDEIRKFTGHVNLIR